MLKFLNFAEEYCNGNFIDGPVFQLFDEEPFSSRVFPHYLRRTKLTQADLSAEMRRMRQA